MPNWCYNEITFQADKKTIDLIVSGFKKNKLLETLAPLPPHDKADWYATQTTHWNTKWDVGADLGHLSRTSDTSVFIGVSTAWCPPCGAYEKAETHHPNLTITARFAEPGFGYCGYYTTATGEVFIDAPCNAKEIEAIASQHPEIADFIHESFGYLYEEEDQ